MKTAFLVITLAVMAMSVKSRGISYRRRFKDAFKAFMNDPAPADCSGCFQDCYKVGDTANQISICSQECHCSSNDQADYLNDAFMNDPAPDCPGCFEDCYQKGDDQQQIEICSDECNC